jgi:DNA-binding NarL/FixJ family response regulator
MEALRILVANEHSLARRGLKTVLERHPGWLICGEARTGGEAVSEAAKLKPDVAILDINMPGLGGREATKRIRTVSPQTEVLILSPFSSDRLVQEILAVGARGCILESESDSDLINAVTAIANREPFSAKPRERPADVAVLPEIAPVLGKLPRLKKNNGSDTLPRGQESGLALKSLFDGGSSSRPAPTEIEQMRQQLAEAIELVAPPLEVQLARINRGKSDDLNAQDYMTDEFFAVAVRFFRIDGGRSERLPRLCCEMFSALASSKYHGLSVSTMARLMSEVGKAFPERYAGALQESSFLCVTLLRSSDQAFGTNYAEKIGRCLHDFAGILPADPGDPSLGEESELRRMALILRVKPSPSEPAIPRARVASEAGRFDQIVQDQPRSSEEIWRVAADRPLQEVPESVPESPQVAARAMTRSAIKEGIQTVLRIFPSLHKIKNWLNSPTR